jgi:DNA-binding NtrC family response regulator
MMPNVLIIESNNALRILYQEWLTLSGYSAHPADTTLAAEDKLNSRHYQAVILDIDAAGERGMDFLREFWLQFKIDGTQVGVISREEKLRGTCEDMGIAFFPKPIRMRDLEDVVGNLLYGEYRPAVTRPLPALV